MTIKTLTTTLLLAASLLLFTACDSKVETNAVDEQSPAVQIDTTAIDTGDEGTTGSGSAENNATTETNTATTVNTDGSTETNTTVATNGNTTETNTTVPTANIKSLKLTVGKTSLNREENTTLKVEIIYDDNTAKDVTDQVVWTATPKDTLKVANNTLISLRDINTTLQAKLGTRVSNTVNLELYWEVRGHKLPPEPDKTLNDSTLLGMDTNKNNVRDDVERWIYETYKDKHPIHIDIAMQAGRAYAQVLKTPERAKEIREMVNAPLACNWYYWKDAKEFNEPLLVSERIDTKVFSIVFNTKERSDTYWQYDKLLSGGVYDIPWADEEKKFCDFNTSKYEK